MKKYSWSFDEYSEVYGNDSHDTIEECIADAQEKDGIFGDHHSFVYIGVNVPFVPSVDSTIVLDAVQDQAIDHTGQLGHDWDACDYQKRAEIAELDEKMTAVLHEWLKKYGRWPEFYAVEDITEYPIGGLS